MRSSWRSPRGARSRNCWPPVASQSELNTLTSKAGVLRNWTPITGNGPLAVRTICVACACVRPKWATHSPTPELIPPGHQGVDHLGDPGLAHVDGRGPLSGPGLARVAGQCPRHPAGRAGRGGGSRLDVQDVGGRVGGGGVLVDPHRARVGGEVGVGPLDVRAGPGRVCRLPEHLPAALLRCRAWRGRPGPVSPSGQASPVGQLVPPDFFPQPAARPTAITSEWPCGPDLKHERRHPARPRASENTTFGPCRPGFRP